MAGRYLAFLSLPNFPHQMPINESEQPGSPGIQGNHTGCGLVSSCTSIQTKEQFRNLLDHNLWRHYSTNRAPLSLSFDPSWLVANQGFTEVLEEWMASLSTRYNDEVYFVTELQVRAGEFCEALVGDPVDARPCQSGEHLGLLGVEGQV